MDRAPSSRSAGIKPAPGRSPVAPGRMPAVPEPDHRRAPLLEAVLRAARAGALRLHTPAHRGVVDAEYGAALGSALALDLTELDETDDLRDPRGAIAEAQALAAAHFGADRTWFLVNGASAGNCAALLSMAAGPSRKVVVGRDAHVSVVNALILADLDPIWVPAGWDARWGIALPPTAAAYAGALAGHPDAAGLVVTGPSYFGDRADIAGIRAVAGERPLIVDEAHGAHIPRALAAGADVVVHSAHKGLSGPTQGGYLHLRGDRVPPGRIAAALRLLQSTSPSYWLLAGLDAARRDAALRPPGGGNALEALRAAGLTVRDTADPTRIVVRFPDGLAAYDILAARGIVAEAALPGGVLFLASHLDPASLESLIRACRELARPGEPGDLLPPPPIAGAVMSPRAAALGPSTAVALPEAIGRICAEAACPYPPGIPVLVPGEEITPDAAAYLAARARDLAAIAVVAGDPLAAEVAQHGRRPRHSVVEERA